MKTPPLQLPSCVRGRCVARRSGNQCTSRPFSRHRYLSTRGSAVRRLVQQGEEQRIPDTTPLVEQVQEDENALTAFDALQQKESEIEKSGEQVALWVGAALLFGVGVWAFMGGEKGEEYFAGYLLEQSLSVDNLFVFILVFDYFKTPVDKQQRVLGVGIATAAVLRLVMILLGIDIIESFEPVLLVFAAILVVSSLKLLLADQEAEQDLSQNPLVKLLNRVLATTDNYVDDRFFVVEDGVRKATPLLLALAVIELSDVVFAVDSIPAVFGITLDPFIVYSSNMFAILSLRSLYGFVSTVMNKLVYLDKSVALVLGFIGIKMLADFMGYHVSTEVSLGVVASLLAGGVLLSLGTSAASSDAK